MKFKEILPVKILDLYLCWVIAAFQQVLQMLLRNSAGHYH